MNVETLLPLFIAIFGSTGFWSFLQSRNDKSKKILDSLDDIRNRITILENANEEKDALNWRNQIVRFSDEIRGGVKHSRDGYDHILIIADKYLAYCSSHEGFKNSIAEVSIKKIKQHYEADDFL